MPDILVYDFGGRLPKRSKRLLPENYSQEANNVKLLSGELRGLHALSLVHEFPDATLPKSVWRVENTGEPKEDAWFSSQDPKAALVKSPLINDAFDRWFLFEDGQPAQVLTFTDIKNDTGPYALNFTHPTTPPTLVPTIFDAGAQLQTRVYVYTYVTEWGEESTPSAPQTVEVDEGGTVAISDFYVPAPTIEGRAFETLRIYRTVTGEESTSFFFLADLTWLDDLYVDSISSAIVALNETLTAANNEPAPDGLFGARIHPSGSTVAVKGRDIYFSKPYLPHAWPEEYRLSVADEIVGIEVFEQNTAIMTAGRPNLAYGATPENQGLLKFSFPEPCIAHGSIVGSPEGAYYASHQGLVLMTSIGPTNISRDIIGKEEWGNDYATPEMSCARYGTQYVGLESPTEGFIIDNSDTRIALTDILAVGTQSFVSMTEDLYTGDVYLVAGDDVFLWDDPDAPEVDYMWKSKQQVIPKPVNQGMVQVHLEERTIEYVPPGGTLPGAYPAEYANIDKLNEVLVEVWVNDVRKFVGPCKNREQVRLPSGFKGDSWEFRITGQCRVYSIKLSETGNA